MSAHAYTNNNYAHHIFTRIRAMAVLVTKWETTSAIKCHRNKLDDLRTNRDLITFAFLVYLRPFCAIWSCAHNALHSERWMAAVVATWRDVARNGRQRVRTAWNDTRTGPQHTHRRTPRSESERERANMCTRMCCRKPHIDKIRRTNLSSFRHSRRPAALRRKTCGWLYNADDANDDDYDDVTKRKPLFHADSVAVVVIWFFVTTE